MYIPKMFVNDDQDAILGFIQKYSFGVIVTAQNNLPIATHIPFVAELKNSEIILSSHFAKANPQGQQLPDIDVLVIFSEPHAYISPKHYEKEQSVPTLNYIAVHAYGKAKIVNNESQQLLLMEKMINQYDNGYLTQWGNLPMEFKSRILKGIVAFEIKVTSLQAQNKLSQNKTENERKSIISTLEVTGNTNEAAIAQYMKEL